MKLVFLTLWRTADSNTHFGRFKQHRIPLAIFPSSNISHFKLRVVLVSSTRNSGTSIRLFCGTAHLLHLLLATLKLFHNYIVPHKTKVKFSKCVSRTELPSTENGPPLNLPVFLIIQCALFLSNRLPLTLQPAHCNKCAGEDRNIKMRRVKCDVQSCEKISV